MISRRGFLAGLAAALPAAARENFEAYVGTNIYSFRYLAERDLPGTLRLIHDLGFPEVEVGDLYGRTAAQFSELLKTAKLRATSFGVAYDALAKGPAAVADQARTLGASYVVCSTIPHSAKHLTADDCKPAAEHLNRWGERLADAGVHLCYHTHGTEFDPSPDGTVFDTLAKLADSSVVNFEMDIFWVVYGHQDPVKLLRRYTGRFPLMHIKDIRKGTVLGGSPADVQENDSVPLGTGLVDVSAALFAGQRAGVRHFYLEEEAVDAVPQIRQSLEFIKTLR